MHRSMGEHSRTLQVASVVASQVKS